MSTEPVIKFLDLKEVYPNPGVMEELQQAASRVIASGWYLHGPETAAFERELAESCEADYAVGVSNGLDALRLIFRALIELGRLRPGDEVVYPANTYIASILPLDEFGLKGIGVEPDPDTSNLDWNKALAAVTPKTKALLTVHLYGRPSWDFEIAEELKERGIFIIEDNAQAIGAKIQDPDGKTHSTGSLGTAAAFSFYPTKNVGAIGDAGAVTTSSPALADTVRALANYGSDRRYHNLYRGYNCRLDEIQAAMLRVKLHHVAEIRRLRQRLARLYIDSISHPDIRLPEDTDRMEQVWHQFPIHTARRDELRQWLADHGIQTDIHYATPPHLQPCYEGRRGDFPVTELLADTEISLPIASASEEEVRRVAETINAFPTQSPRNEQH